MVTTPQTWWSCGNTVERVRYKWGAFFEVETSFSLHFCKWGANFEVEFKKKCMVTTLKTRWSSWNTVERVKQKWIAFFEVETLFSLHFCKWGANFEVAFKNICMSFSRTFSSSFSALRTRFVKFVEKCCLEAAIHQTLISHIVV